MKKLLIIGFAMLLGMSAMAQMDAGPHDLGDDALGTTEICIFCHTPHNAIVNAPLWNRNSPAGPYTVYDSTVSPTMDSVVGQPAGVSLMCLSCHDDTVGMDAYGGAAGDVANNMTGIGAAANHILGTGLSNDHPISFTYNSALDAGLNADNGDGTVGTQSLQLFGAGADQLECATCHDPHDNTNTNFLVMSNGNSALCTQCHNK